MTAAEQHRQVVVIGGGQAGLAAGYYLRRAGLDFAILDAARAPGGAWQHYWDSLRLFSPAEYSSLPGRPMPHQSGAPYPDARHVAAYLAAYEERYQLPVHRPVHVTGVERSPDHLTVRTSADTGAWHAQAVVFATGSWQRPFVPAVPGRELFTGHQLHTAGYRRAADFAGQRVVVVGGGNSGAQIAADLTAADLTAADLTAADLTATAETRWVTRRPPHFLPDSVDGRALFELATHQVRAHAAGETHTGVASLGDIVATAPVRAARDSGLLTAHPMFDRLSPTGPVWADGSTWDCDTIIWCTGFRPDLAATRPLGLHRHRGRIPTDGTRALEDPRIHLLGYGNWTGPASATLIGVGRTARVAVEQIRTLLG
ncbi:ArsO family NAD(P)H-dependent flavin-containing monooxygenase [Kitasatospora sp. CB01950]|uniref:ArsO family NAD(P)H-dependent flavin-containing monooxygenase n=1 Tax=Kitasatospora sp. CB01950 TaxID=1703930 RepID=UPI00093FE6EE|nr:ArsO family NAD(P)H-dependent flavin-containing monooxygenase [Kitasatospora sp. CB01950]OKJ02996.1 pyridine nucleotide-disulfide oxidoreductase [Kitasatospora sp. CB01950]